MKKERLQLLLIILLSVLLRLIWVLNSPPLYYDEVEFMLLARSLSKGNGYALTYGTWHMSRPPLLPAILFCLFQCFGESQTLAHLTCVAASSLAIFGTYLLAKEMYGERVAFFAATFTGLNPIHVLMASTILSENLFALLEPLFVLAVLRSNKRRWIVAACIFFTLLFLARYTTLYIGMFILLWMCLERRTQLIKLIRSPYLYVGVAMAMLILIPWFMIGQHYYGSPLGSMIEYASIQGTYENLSELAMFTAASIAVIPVVPLFLLPFFIIGITKKGNSWHNFLLIWIAISMILSAATKPLVRISIILAITYSLRYNFISFPAFALATGRGLENTLSGEGGKRVKKVLIAALLLMNLAASVYLPYYNRYIRDQDHMVKSYREASTYLASNTDINEYILTNVPAFISYYSYRNCLLIPDSFSDLMTLLRQMNSSYLVVSFHEAQIDRPPPPYLSTIMNDRHFELAHGSELVQIFRYKG